MAIDGAGNVYVADTSNNRVQKFDAGGAYLTQWGSGGSGSSQLDPPAGVAVDGAGNVYVADSNNHHIQKFDGSGSYLSQWGVNGSGNGQLVSPGRGRRRGRQCLRGRQRQQPHPEVRRRSSCLSKWGSFGSGSGQFQYPTGVAVDGSGNVYVAELTTTASRSLARRL